MGTNFAPVLATRDAMFVPDLAERTGIEPVTSDLQIPGSEPRLGQIRSVNGVGSGEEESERSRADVFCAQSEGSSGSDACSDEDEQRLDEGTGTSLRIWPASRPRSISATSGAVKPGSGGRRSRKRTMKCSPTATSALVARASASSKGTRSRFASSSRRAACSFAAASSARRSDSRVGK